MKVSEGGKGLGHYLPGTVWGDVDDLVFCLFSEAVLLCSPGWPRQSFYLRLLSSAGLFLSVIRCMRERLRARCQAGTALETA